MRITVVAAAAELLLVFGSLMLLDTVAVFVMIVPSLVPGLTATTIVKVADSPEARLDFVQVIVPATLTVVDGLTQLQPVAPEFETKGVSLGNGSLRLTLEATDGPLLVTVTV